MSEKSTTPVLFNAEVPESVDKAFQNLTGNLTQNVGSTLSDIWYLVFGGLSHLAEKRKAKYAHSLKQFQEELESSVKKIPPEKRLEPSFQVTAQALENVKYCITEKELREMFTSLISNSLNSDFSKDVHPSFAEIIKQMSVLDAQILKIFKNSSPSGIPVCDYRLLSPDKTSYSTILENAFLGLPEIALDRCSASLSSLKRLGILQIPYGVYLNPPKIYNAFKKHPYYTLLQIQFPAEQIAVEKHVAKLTALGISFVHVCVPD